MPGPVEMRQFFRKATIEDIANGLQPLRQMTGAGPQLFWPAVLQYRFKEKDAESGKVVWSPWIDVLFEREGDPPPH